MLIYPSSHHSLSPFPASGRWGNSFTFLRNFRHMCTHTNLCNHLKIYITFLLNVKIFLLAKCFCVCVCAHLMFVSSSYLESASLCTGHSTYKNTKMADKFFSSPSSYKTRQWACEFRCRRWRKEIASRSARFARLSNLFHVRPGFLFWKAIKKFLNKIIPYDWLPSVSSYARE